jgi:hypothetical protein
MQTRPKILNPLGTLFGLLLGVVSFCAGSSEALSRCLSSPREIQFSDGLARVAGYICKQTQAAEPQIRVEFYRLNEAAAGSLIESASYPELQRAIGTPRVLENSVQGEVKRLFDRFGTKSVQESCFQLGIETSVVGGSYDQPSARCGKRTIWSLTTTIEMPLLEATLYAQQRLDWPPGYRLFYNACPGNELAACTVLWRFVKQADIQDYAAKKRRYDQYLESPSDLAGASDSSSPELGKATERYLSLLEYLSRDGWRDDFLTVTATADNCAAGLVFILDVREMILDVALFENISSQPVSLDRLFGSAPSESNLRLASMPSQDPIPISVPHTVIRPGERLAIPLRISFAVPDSLRTIFNDVGAARTTFARIQATPRGTIFYQNSGDGDLPAIEKVREGFESPTIPSFATYVYGPEVSLRGLLLNSERIDLDQQSDSFSFIHLTVGNEMGSCPVLYAWDGEAWVRRGKIIDQANTKERQATQRVSFESLVSRFRLREEELEVSYIDRARLDVELADGRHIVLGPETESLVDIDEHYATIRSGQTLDLNFKLPAHVRPDNIRRSTLEITGYYLRYSGMRMSTR